MSKFISLLKRYLIIDNYLRKNNYTTLDQLKNACSNYIGNENISSRTIRNDITNLKNGVLGSIAPIKNKRGKGYYYDSENDFYFSIVNLLLSDKDVASIEVASLLMSQFENSLTINNFKDLANRITKTSSGIELIESDKIKADDIIHFESINAKGGRAHIFDIISAIKNHKKISFKYKARYGKNEKLHIISPFYLKEYENRWYIIGLENTIEKPYCLDRISDFNITTANIDSQYTSHHEKYKNLYGIFLSNEPPMDLQISFPKNERKTGDLIKALPLHHSQHLISENNIETIFGYKICDTLDFKRKIISYGNDLIILKPKHFRESIKMELKEAYLNYEREY